MNVVINQIRTTHNPTRSFPNDAGADVCAPEDVTIKAGGVTTIPLGFSVEIPAGHAGFIFPRSGLSRAGILAQLPPIDSGYRGEIHAVILNASGADYHVKAGERIGQLVIVPVVIATFVDRIESRGDRGFGSTGK